MNLQFGAHPAFFGLIGFNVTAVLVAVAVLLVALFQRSRRRETRLFELAFLLFLVSFTFMTLHGRLLQYMLPFHLPEQPLIDNNLTLNYFAANVLTYAAFPLLAILIINRHFSAEKLGLKVNNGKKTAAYTVLGIMFASSIFAVSDHFVHQQWVNGYTSEGLVTWVLLVTIASAFLQTIFYAGVLFNRYLEKENVLLLGLIGVFAFQSFVAPNSLPWQATSMLIFSSELFVTWKTRSVYGAASIAIAVGLIELTLQIL
jgi:hypothetical protein